MQSTWPEMLSGGARWIDSALPTPLWGARSVRALALLMSRAHYYIAYLFASPRCSPPPPSCSRTVPPLKQSHSAPGTRGPSPSPSPPAPTLEAPYSTPHFSPAFSPRIAGCGGTSPAGSPALHLPALTVRTPLREVTTLAARGCILLVGGSGDGGAVSVYDTGTPPPLGAGGMQGRPHTAVALGRRGAHEVRKEIARGRTKAERIVVISGEAERSGRKVSDARRRRADDSREAAAVAAAAARAAATARLVRALRHCISNGASGPDLARMRSPCRVVLVS